jgi:exonuclease III|tara:strand:- start:1716 stop:2387 length:672 start_codon:yes stop_codon:yes gene_type:complete
MQDYNYKWRIDLICDKILNENPDVICFQEVISSFFDIIKKKLPEYSSVFSEIYENNTTERAYGEVILSKNPIISKGFDKITSNQGRVNSWVEINIGDKIVRINTSQLESTENYTKSMLKKVMGVRQEQLSDIKRNNSNNEYWLWIGDTNLLEEEEHEMFNSSINTYFSNRFTVKDKKVSVYKHTYDKVWVNKLGINYLYTLNGFGRDCYYLSDHDGLSICIQV